MYQENVEAKYNVLSFLLSSQVLKEILSYAGDQSHGHGEQFSAILDDLKKDRKLERSLIKQLKMVIDEPLPSK